MRGEAQTAAWTDYPIVSLGDQSGEAAPVRQIKLISYDLDKYVTVEFEGGHREAIKAGYCYILPGRHGEVDKVPMAIIRGLATTPATPEATAINAVGSLVARLREPRLVNWSGRQGYEPPPELDIRAAEAIEEAAAEIERLTSALAARAEECAKIAETFTQSQHLLHDMKAGTFPACSPIEAAIAAAIRSLQEQNK